MMCGRNQKKSNKKGGTAAAFFKQVDYLYRSALMVTLLPRSCHWRVMW